MKKLLLGLILLIGLLVACTPTVPASNPLPAPEKSDVDTNVLEVAIPSNLEPSISPSGNLLLTKWESSQTLLYQLNPETWTEVAEVKPISLGQEQTYTFSPDKRTLAIIYKPAYTPRTLGFIDLARWEILPTEIVIEEWVPAFVYSPDGQQVAFTYPGKLERGSNGHTHPKDYQLVVVNVPSRSLVAQVSLDFTARFLAYTADSQQLVAYGGELKPDDPEKFAPSQAALFRASDLQQVWEQLLPEVVDGNYEGEVVEDMPQLTGWQPAVTFSPTEQKLYIVHAHEDKFTMVDFASRSAHTMTIQPALSWIEQLLAWDAGTAEAKVYDGTYKQALLSPDGQKLYVIGYTDDTWQDDKGNWNFKQTPLGLQLIDTTTGTEVARLETSAQRLQWSADGSLIYLHKWEMEREKAAIELVDAGTLTRLAQSDHAPAYRTWLTSGQPILLTSHEERNGFRFSILDPQTLQTLNTTWVRGANLYFITE